MLHYDMYTNSITVKQFFKVSVLPLRKGKWKLSVCEHVASALNPEVWLYATSVTDAARILRSGGAGCDRDTVRKRRFYLLPAATWPSGGSVAHSLSPTCGSPHTPAGESAFRRLWFKQAVLWRSYENVSDFHSKSFKICSRTTRSCVRALKLLLVPLRLCK